MPLPPAAAGAVATRRRLPPGSAQASSNVLACNQQVPAALPVPASVSPFHALIISHVGPSL